MNVRYKGSISISSLSLPDTYLIPKLNFSLISIGQLCDLSYELTFSSSRYRVEIHRLDNSLGLDVRS